MPSPEQRSFANVREQFTDPSITIIYNEKAGIYKKNPFRALKFRHEMHSLQSLGNPELFNLDIELQPTKSASHAIDVVGDAIDRRRGAIAVVGGDGTVAPIAHRLAVERDTLKPDLLVLGGGTQNIFQGELTKRRDPFKAALDLLMNGRKIHADIGVITNDSDHYPFLANAGIGMDAHVMKLWEEAGKKHRGQVFPIFWRERNMFKPFDIHVSDPHEGIDRTYEDVLAMPIINAGKYGGFFSVTDSDMSDGMLESVILPSPLKDPQEFMRMVPRILFTGTSIEGAHYMGIKDAKIRETRGEELIFQHDGDPVQAGSSEISVTTIPQAVAVWAA